MEIPARKPEWKPGDEVLLFGVTRYLTRPSPSGRGMWFVATVPTHPAVEVEIHERYFEPSPRRKPETQPTAWHVGDFALVGGGDLDGKTVLLRERLNRIGDVQFWNVTARTDYGLTYFLPESKLKARSVASAFFKQNQPPPSAAHETRTSYDLAPPGEREWAPGAMAYTEKFSAGPALVTLVERNECHERCWLVEPGDDGEGNAFLYEDEFRRARPQDIARATPTRAPAPPPKADAYSSVLGAVAWREQDRDNRRLHVALTDGTDSVSLWATTLRPLRDRELRLAKHLPAAEVPAVLDGLMMSPDDRPTYPTGLDILMEEVG